MIVYIISSTLVGYIAGLALGFIIGYYWKKG